MSDRHEDGAEAVLLDVTIEQGKYRIIQTRTGGLTVQRHGEPWRDCTGDKLVLCLAQEVERLRKVVDDLSDMMRRATEALRA